MSNPSKKILEAFAEIQQPRSRFALESYVVGGKFTPETRWAQCVLEAQIKWDAIRLGRLDLERINLEIAAVTTPGRLGEIEKEKKAIEREQIKRAMLGAERELACLCEIFESFGTTYTHEQIEGAQQAEERNRLCTHAVQEMAAFGYVAPGTQDAMRRVGATIIVDPAIDGRAPTVRCEFTQDAKSIEGPTTLKGLP
jgi:hypothetical protein